MSPFTSFLPEAKQKLEDRLAAAAREKLAQASKESKEKQLQAERKRKAALFLQTLRNPAPDADAAKVEEAPFSAEVGARAGSGRGAGVAPWGPSRAVGGALLRLASPLALQLGSGPLAHTLPPQVLGALETQRRAGPAVELTLRASHAGACGTRQRGPRLLPPRGWVFSGPS